MTENIYTTKSWQDAASIARVHGFCVVEDFFAPVEIANWEAVATGLSAMDRIKDFLSLPAFHPLLFDHRVLRLARALLGQDLIYYGETSCAIDNDPFRSWHCDARGTRKDVTADSEVSGSEVYPAWRFAIYFRDYRAASGGLKVSPGSHLKPPESMRSKERMDLEYLVDGQRLTVPAPPFPIHNVQSRPGDLVIFNLRMFHSAGALLLKGSHQAQLMPEVEAFLLDRVPDLFEPYPAELRNALFFDYGAPTEALDLYIKWRAHGILNDPKLHSALWDRSLRETDAGVYSYDQVLPSRAAETHGVAPRYDRIIAQLLYKQKLIGPLSPADRVRLDRLFRINKEFSPFHSMTVHAH